MYLHEPNKDIEHEVGENDFLSYAAGSMQGWRLNMVSLFDLESPSPFHYPSRGPSKVMGE